ncbi:hypothetical protein IRT38_01065 (plasmid) [Acinetobacter sp. SK-43]|uniref:hypothetical protein n=1 Tax=Acinetobacter sp. SK-43 TaxID=2785295 RepID=UPI00188CA43D|nr:hypothetical protein [Acinetobacter sp. SK-43]MBF4454007.1 hypothetical protein [Acinetobacter sp. SK-43]
MHKKSQILLGILIAIPTILFFTIYALKAAKLGPSGFTEYLHTTESMQYALFYFVAVLCAYFIAKLVPFEAKPND